MRTCSLRERRHPLLAGGGETKLHQARGDTLTGTVIGHLRRAIRVDRPGPAGAIGASESSVSAASPTLAPVRIKSGAGSVSPLVEIETRVPPAGFQTTSSPPPSARRITPCRTVAAPTAVLGSDSIFRPSCAMVFVAPLKPCSKRSCSPRWVPTSADDHRQITNLLVGQIGSATPARRPISRDTASFDSDDPFSNGARALGSVPSSGRNSIAALVSSPKPT